MAAYLSEPLSILGYPSTNCVPAHSSLKAPLARYRKGGDTLGLSEYFYGRRYYGGQG